MAGQIRVNHLRVLIRQDLNQRFAGNAVGVAWALILPLLQLALFGLLFVQIFKARAPGFEGVGYLAFLALGMWPWFAFSEAVARGAGALVDNAGLLAKVAISHWQLIAARVVVAFVLHGLGLVLVLVVLALVGAPLQWWRLPVALAAWVLLLPLALATACVFAQLQAFVRDLVQILPYLLSTVMFASPILYHGSLMPEWLRAAQRFNPIGTAIASVRDPLLTGVWPEDLWLTAGLIAVIVGVSVWVYRRLRPYVEDFL
jgi:ABC-type polysaccharide/polyol phosphate export permease